MSDKIEREKFTVDEELLGEIYFLNSQLEWEGDTYTLIFKEMTNGDGECWRMIMQRERDKKCFKWSYCVSHKSGNYYWAPEFKEVFPKTITTVIYE